MTKREKEIFIHAYNAAIDRASIRAYVDSMDPRCSLLGLHESIHDEKIHDQSVDWPACENPDCFRLLGHEFNNIPHGPYNPEVTDL